VTIGVVIKQGDCREVLAEMPDESVDAIVTDPPYGETSLAWDKWPVGWVSAARRVLKRTGSMWVFGSQRMFWEQRGEFSGWRLAQDIIWEKHNGSSLFNDRFRRVHEVALQFYRDDAKWADVYKCPQFTNDARARVVRKKARPAQWIGATGQTVYRSEDGGPRLMRSVIFCRSEHGRAQHPTQKPIGVMKWAIGHLPATGSTTLDPFMGSGTTGVAAVQMGRDFIGIEREESYFEIACRRIEQAQRQGDLFIGGAA